MAEYRPALQGLRSAESLSIQDICRHLSNERKTELSLDIDSPCNLLSSVGNLLMIVVMLLVDVFLMEGVLPTVWSTLGCGMIAGGFGVLVWDIVGATRMQEDELRAEG